jgi:hypothetical protein
MVELFYKDFKRYEMLKEKLNLSDYELVETYPYKRETRYEKFIREVRTKMIDDQRAKLELVRIEFEKQKELFFKEKEKALEEIRKEIIELGFKDLKFPSSNEASQIRT